jgi:tRNA(fMet)-specific endonuclease VapC
MPLYMLDTDISSYIMKRSHDNVLYRLRAGPTDDFCISVVTKSELIYGVEVSPNRHRDQTALDEFLRHVEVLDFPEAAALHYGQIRGLLRRQGMMIGANDLFIAAHARYLGLILATNNVREFGRVEGLKIENWAESSI